MTEMSLIRADWLREHLRVADLVEPMAEAFRHVSAGTAQNGMIALFPAEDRNAGDVYVKAGAIPGREVFIVKVAPWFAANVVQGTPQSGFVAIMDARTGHTRALLEDEHFLSDARTAAAGALTARLFAPAEIETAAVLGAGTQARLQVLALHEERPFRRFVIWARNPAKAQELASAIGAALPEVECSLAQSVEAAVRASDVLITATLSREPLVRGAWLRPGQHITAVGSDDPTKCELDAETLLRSRVFVDERAATLANGDVCRAIGKDIAPDRLITGEIGEVLAGSIPGRRSPDDITVAKLVGVGAQDLVAAERVLAVIETRRSR